MSEDGELPSDEEEFDGDMEDEEDDDNHPSGLFDALAAAQEAEERYRLLQEGGGPIRQVEEDRLQEGFLTDSFIAALRLQVIEDDSEEKTGEVKWQVGDRCSALFSGDGEWYRAKVLLLKEWRNSAVVRFTDYGNEEEVPLADMTKASPGSASKVIRMYIYYNI